MGIYQQNKAMFLSYKEEFCFEWADFNEQVIWEPNWPHVGKLKFLHIYVWGTGFKQTPHTQQQANR